MMCCLSPTTVLPPAFISEGKYVTSSPLALTHETMPGLLFNTLPAPTLYKQALPCLTIDEHLQLEVCLLLMQRLAVTYRFCAGASFMSKEATPMMTGESLTGYLEDHFFKHLPGGCSPDNPALIICDGHASRCSDSLVAACQARGLRVLVLPARLSDVLQPWDQVFGGFKRKLGSLRTSSAIAQENMSQQTWMALVGKAYSLTCTANALANAFRTTGLVPLSADTVLAKLPGAQGSKPDRAVQSIKAAFKAQGDVDALHKRNNDAV